MQDSLDLTIPFCVIVGVALGVFIWFLVKSLIRKPPKHRQKPTN